MGEITQDNKWYMSTTYEEAKKIIGSNITQMSRSFVAVGFYLKHIRDNEMYLEDGYKSIWDFAEDQYGISRSTATRWMAMNDRFSQDGNSPNLAEQYKNFGKSQLQEMLYLTDEQAAEVTEDMTVKEIRELRKPAKEEPLKPYEKHGCITGWSRYPEFCSCCGHGGAECCSQCDSDTCNSRCGWVDDPYLPEAEKPGCATSHMTDERSTEVISVGAEEHTREAVRDEKASEQVSEPEVVDTEPTSREINERSIDDLNFSVHTYNVLQRAGVDTAEQLKAMDRDQLVRLRGMGARSLREIEIALGRQEREASQPEDLCDVAQSQEPVIDGECRECGDDIAKDIDVLRDMLRKEKIGLEECIKVDKAEPLPAGIIRKKKLLVGALASMICEIEEMEEQKEKPQPELPLFRNNDQRKEWLRNYKDWGIWYEDTHIGVKYYRYQFDNGAVLVAEVYHQPATKYMAEYDSSYLHLIGGPEPPKGANGIGKWQWHDIYSRYPSSETELVEFLKEVQKK